MIWPAIDHLQKDGTKITKRKDFTYLALFSHMQWLRPCEHEETPVRTLNRALVQHAS